MGILSKIMALLKGIFVKSLSEPPIASRKSWKSSRKKDLGKLDLILICDIDLRIIGLKREKSDGPALKGERVAGHGHISNNSHVFRIMNFKNRCF